MDLCYFNSLVPKHWGSIGQPIHRYESIKCIECNKEINFWVLKEYHAFHSLNIYYQGNNIAIYETKENALFLCLL